jgi:hypothetical protein
MDGHQKFYILTAAKLGANDVCHRRFTSYFYFLLTIKISEFQWVLKEWFKGPIPFLVNYFPAR